MADQKTVTAAEAKQIFATQEDDYSDLKAIEIAPAKLSKTISAFANTAGGEVFLGIAELNKRGKKVRDWVGFEDVEAANAHIQVLESMGQLSNHYHATFLECDGFPGLVLHLIIPKTTDILKATDGTPYVRKGAQNLPVTAREGLARLKLDKGIVTFEDEMVKISNKTVVDLRRPPSSCRRSSLRRKLTNGLRVSFLF